MKTPEELRAEAASLRARANGDAAIMAAADTLEQLADGATAVRRTQPLRNPVARDKRRPERPKR